MRILMEVSERLKNVEWRDLVALNNREIFYELLLSLPWLISSIYIFINYNYFAALICSFMFFLTGLRQVHNAFHYALGISKKHTEWVMLALSIVMLGSMHAVKINHLIHHRYCMQSEDVEAASARMPWWKALLFGPIFPVLLHKKAIEIGSDNQKKWIYAELSLNALVLISVFFILDVSCLKYHFSTMLIAQCLTAFFAVWTVHHDCDEKKEIGRTIRNKIKATVTYNMFFHVEHHLFPHVPTCKLHIVAHRLDKAAPELCLKKVF